MMVKKMNTTIFFSNLYPLCSNLNASLLLNQICLFFFCFFFFENRATKTCQSLALISNLMSLLSGNVKSHLKKRFLNT